MAVSMPLSASQSFNPPTLTPDQKNNLINGARASLARYKATGSFTNLTPEQNLAAAKAPLPKTTGAPINAAVSNGVPAPKGGYGGIDYNTTDAAGRSAIEANEARLKSDPSFVQSELARTDSVLAGMKPGTDNSAQLAYKSKLEGLLPPLSTIQTPPPQQTTASPVPAAQSAPAQQTNYPGMLTADQIKQEAAARIAKQRAGIADAVAAANAGLKNSYDYQNQITKDNRALEDAHNAEVLNPFNGRTSYIEAQAQRNRGIEDTASNNNYQAAVNANNQQLTSFDSLAPEQQQALYDQLTQQERQYGLDVGSLTGVFNNAPTLAAKTAQQNYDLNLAGLSGQLPNGQGQTIQGKTADLNNQLLQLQLNDYPEQSKAQAKLLQQQIASGQISNEAAQLNLNALKDPNSPVNQAAKIDLQLKQLDLKNAPETAKLQLQQLKKTIDQIGAKPYQSQNDIDMDALKLKTAQEQYNQLVAAGKTPTTTPPTKNETESTYVSNVNQMSPTDRTNFFKNEKANIINDLGISGYNQLYSMFYDQYGAPIQ